MLSWGSVTGLLKWNLKAIKLGWVQRRRKKLWNASPKKVSRCQSKQNVMIILRLIFFLFEIKCKKFRIGLETEIPCLEQNGKFWLLQFLIWLEDSQFVHAHFSWGRDIACIFKTVMGVINFGWREKKHYLSTLLGSRNTSACYSTAFTTRN